jgi:uncharacterized protein YutE (UPF0331/DUF86 family)
MFTQDLDRQESILFNLQMAIQHCSDIAAHIISEEGLGVPYYPYPPLRRKARSTS